MQDFNAVKFKLELTNEFALNVFAQLVCGLSFELQTLPRIADFKLEGRNPYAAIGETDRSTFNIHFKEETASFLSCLAVKDNGYKGSVSTEWFEAELSDFKLSMSNNDSANLFVQVLSFKQYDLLLNYVRHFGAKIIEKRLIETQSEESQLKEVPELVDEKHAVAELSSDIIESIPQIVKIGTVEIEECLGFELYQLIENKLMDFLAALGINQHHLLKDQRRYDENGWYQKSFTSRLVKLELELKLDRETSSKKAELSVQMDVLFPHNYLPTKFELKAFHSNPGGFAVNMLELFSETSFASDELTRKLEGDLKTFFMIAAV